MAGESTALTHPAQSPQQGALALTADDQLAFIQEAVRSFDGIMRLAKVISSMESSPVHLRGKDADCFRVTVQAVKWRMDPFAVAECTSLVHGKLCYEGKLVAAVLRSMNAIEGRLSYEITGEGQGASIVVTGTQRGAKKPVSIKGSVKEWRTIGKDKNGNRIDNQWDKQPEVQLVYRGTRVWARVHTPEAILGVYTPDEMEEAREVEGVVVATDPPAARTATAAERAAERGAPKEVTPPAQPPTEQGAPPAGKESDPPPAAPPHPSIAAARDLYRDLNKIEPGYGKKVTGRLCALHGAAEPVKVPADKLDQFAKDVAQLVAVAGDKARIEDLLATWEQAAREAVEGAKP